MAVNQHADVSLQLSMRLHVAANQAEAHLRGTVSGQETGDDGVKRTPAGRDAVGAAGIERETVAAILQRQAPARHDDTRAEAHEITLDEAHNHAALAACGQLDGAPP